MKMLKSNFEATLTMALQLQRDADRLNDVEESAFAKMLKETLNASIRGEKIEID